MRTGLTKFQSPGPDIADLKLATYQMIQRNVPGNDVSAAGAGSQSYSQLVMHRFDSLCLDQCQFAIGLRLGKRSGLIKVTITLQTLPRNCADFIYGLHLGLGCWCDVNGVYGACEHSMKLPSGAGRQRIRRSDRIADRIVENF